MFNVHTELPCGAISRGYERIDEAAALSTFARIVSQVQAWKNYAIDVVLTEDGIEQARETIRNAA